MDFVIQDVTLPCRLVHYVNYVYQVQCVWTKMDRTRWTNRDGDVMVLLKVRTKMYSLADLYQSLPYLHVFNDDLADT